MNNLEENFKNWVLLDNRQKEINEEIKSIREKKTNITNNIFRECDEKNLKSPIIKITDGQLSFIDTKIANPISLKFLEECFKEYFSNQNEVDLLLELIKKKRVYNISKSIKRTFNA